MSRKIGFWLLWAGFSGYAFLLAPPDQPETWDLIVSMSVGRWEGINPLIIALFNLMGVLPLVYFCFILADGRGQKIPAWLFAGAAMGVGAFALLPYLALRESPSRFSGDKDLLLKLTDSRLLGLGLGIACTVLVIFGLKAGNWQDFIAQWQSSRFIHVMSLDFCLLCLLFPALIGDDIQRRGVENRAVFWLATLIPLFGPLGYLVFRPPLPDSPLAQPALASE